MRYFLYSKKKRLFFSYNSYFEGFFMFLRENWENLRVYRNRFRFLEKDKLYRYSANLFLFNFS